MNVSAQYALERLQEGNRRYVGGVAERDLADEHSRRMELLEDQAPIAIILGCSDSRVPAEMVFDQGLGDLFVIRVAGNVVGPSQVGSVEFAALQFGVRLVVVMGHSRCGAVIAALDALDRSAVPESPGLGDIIDRILPGLEAVRDKDRSDDEESRLGRAVRENIQQAARRLESDSDILRRLKQEDGLEIVGAEYAMETGLVDFFSGAERL